MKTIAGLLIIFISLWANAESKGKIEPDQTDAELLADWEKQKTMNRVCSKKEDRKHLWIKMPNSVDGFVQCLDLDLYFYFLKMKKYDEANKLVKPESFVDEIGRAYRASQKAK